MSVAPVTATSASALTALAGTGNPRYLSALPAAEQVKAASGQFEAIMVRQFLQDSVGHMMGGEGGGPGGGIYSYLLTDVLATKLTAGGGMGLSGVIQSQLAPRAARSAAGAATPSAS